MYSSSLIRTVELTQNYLEYMEEEGDGFDPFFDRPRPQRSLQVVLANPRETGAVEFLAAIRDGKLDEVSLRFVSFIKAQI